MSNLTNLPSFDAMMEKLIAEDKKFWAARDAELGVLPKNPDLRNLDQEELDAEEERFFMEGN